MIIRTWNAIATPTGAHAYARHFNSHVLLRLKGTPGFRGAYLLDRNQGDLIGLTVLTLWDSMDSIAAFAPETESAVIDPEAVAALLDYDDGVTHHHVLWHERTATDSGHPTANDDVATAGRGTGLDRSSGKPRHRAWTPFRELPFPDGVLGHQTALVLRDS